MPRDMSSSSEDETVRSEPPTTSRQRNNAKYQCPADFVSFSHKPCSSVLPDSLKDPNTELWLIKAPSNFSPDCFSRLKMPLCGLQTMQAPAAASGSGQIYSVMGGLSGTAGLHLLTSPARRPDQVTCGPAFAGLLNVCESYGDVSSNLAPQPLKASPAPCIPPGLRQRFQPFGSRTPTLSAAEREATPPPTPEPSGSSPSAAVAAPSASLPRPPPTQEREEERRRKKKKKRERSEPTHGGGEEEEPVEVKEEEEPVDVAPEAPGETEERRKKKKKKRDRDRGEGEAAEDDLDDVLCRGVKQEVEVKVEPMDCSYGDVDDSGKKKKKKKKSKHDHD